MIIGFDWFVQLSRWQVEFIYKFIYSKRWRERVYITYDEIGLTRQNKPLESDFVEGIICIDEQRKTIDVQAFGWLDCPRHRNHS